MTDFVTEEAIEAVKVSVVNGEFLGITGSKGKLVKVVPDQNIDDGKVILSFEKQHYLEFPKQVTVTLKIGDTQTLQVELISDTLDAVYLKGMARAPRTAEDRDKLWQEVRKRGLNPFAQAVVARAMKTTPTLKLDPAFEAYRKLSKRQRLLLRNALKHRRNPPREETPREDDLKDAGELPAPVRQDLERLAPASRSSARRAGEASAPAKRHGH